MTHEINISRNEFQLLELALTHAIEHLEYMFETSPDIIHPATKYKELLQRLEALDEFSGQFFILSLQNIVPCIQTI